MGNMKEIFVFIFHLPVKNYVNLGILSPIGKMPAGQVRYKFQYAPSWLARADSYAIDPIHLPLHDMPFYPADNLEVHGIFEDVCPDSWGKKILRTTHNLPDNAGIMDYILNMPIHKIGNLQFSLSPEAPDFDELFYIQFNYFDKNRDKIMNILQPDSNISGSNASAGGANPKFLAIDSLIKLPNRNAQIDDLKAEYVCLNIIKNMGLLPPEFTFTILENQLWLVLFRFDMVDLDNKVFLPLGYMSLASALGLRHDDYRTNKSYIDYYNVAQRLGCKGLTMPLGEEIFTRAIMNILLGNSDDHAKNHGFLCHNGKWELAPVFDIVPQFNDKMALKLATGHQCDLDDGFALHRGLKIDETRARNIVKLAIQHTNQFAEIAKSHPEKKCHITDEDLQKIMNRKNKIPEEVLKKYA